MTEIIDLINNLINNAKENQLLDNVRFVKEYKGNLAENPVENYLAVVKIDKIVKGDSILIEYKMRGDIFKVNLEIKLYSGNNISGEDLGSTALNIQQAINKADKNNYIDSTYILPIEFDSNVNAIYRTICFTLSFCYLEDE